MGCIKKIFLLVLIILCISLMIYRNEEFNIKAITLIFESLVLFSMFIFIPILTKNKQLENFANKLFVLFEKVEKYNFFNTYHVIALMYLVIIFLGSLLVVQLASLLVKLALIFVFGLCAKCLLFSVKKVKKYKAINLTKFIEILTQIFMVCLLTFYCICLADKPFNETLNCLSIIMRLIITGELIYLIIYFKRV